MIKYRMLSGNVMGLEIPEEPEIQVFLGSVNAVEIDLSALRGNTGLFSIDLSENKLQKIDLEPLEKCTGLREVSLSFNDLQHIDLTPLSSCKKLTSIDLSVNRITEIDLDPLEYLTKLQKIRMTGNRIRTVDLSPLRNNEGELNIDLSGNQIEDIDLTPLAAHLNPITIDLKFNSIEEIDVTPIIFPEESPIEIVLSMNTKTWTWMLKKHAPKISGLELTYREIESWSQVHKLLCQVKDYSPRYQHMVLDLIGLTHYGFVDSDLLFELQSIPEGSTIEEVRESITPLIVERLIEQIENDGTTIGLDIKHMIEQGEEVIVDLSRIIYLREKELHEIEVWRHHKSTEPDNKINLASLWLTAYGYVICSGLGLKLFTDESGLEKIKHALESLGYELKVNDTEVIHSDTKITQELHNYITNLAYFGKI